MVFDVKIMQLSPFGGGERGGLTDRRPEPVVRHAACIVLENAADYVPDVVAGARFYHTDVALGALGGRVDLQAPRALLFGRAGLELGVGAQRGQRERVAQDAPQVGGLRAGPVDDIRRGVCT